MNLADYLLDASKFDAVACLEAWHWLIPSGARVWLTNRFAEFVLLLDDGSVALLETSSGALKKLARDREEFIVKIDEGSNASDWLMIPLVDQCVAAGMTLEAHQCYGFKTPPTLGGPYELANVEVIDIAVYLALMGQIHEQIKDTPDGTPVKLVVSE